MVSRIDFYHECCEILEKSGNEDAEFDVLCMFQDVLHEKHPLFRPKDEIEADRQHIIEDMVCRRKNGYPLQYILGEWEFYGYNFKVNENVLIPRPDTETLIEDVKNIVRENKLENPKILDLCCGSGCIAVTLKKEIPSADVHAVEISEKAAEVIRENAKLNNAEINLTVGDVRDRDIIDKFSGFDIIVSNPPYLTQHDMDTLQTEVKHEPSLALFGGNDGLEFYHDITRDWKKCLKTDGWLCYEFGMGQHDDVGKIMEENNYSNIKFSKDLGGIIRTVNAQKTEE